MHLIDSLVFPAPKPTYDEIGPFREYMVGNQYWEIDREDPECEKEFPFSYYQAVLFYAAGIPCLQIGVGAVEKASQVIIYAHANHEDMWREHAVLERISRSLGVHVVAFEYPGYSIAEGVACEATVNDALKQVYRCIRRDFGFSGEDVFLMGRSIGTGVATHFAAHNHIGGLVLVSPFTSIKAVVLYGGGSYKRLGPLGASLIAERFPSLMEIPRTKCPTVFVHGNRDVIVPVQHSEQLLEASGASSKEFVRFPEADHDNIFEEEYLEAAIEAMKRILPLKENASPREIHVTSGQQFDEPGVSQRIWVDLSEEEEMVCVPK